MPDITQNRRPSVPPGQRLQLRRLELEVEQTKIGIMQREIRIEELEAQIETEHTTVAALREHLAERERQLQEFRSERQVNDG